MRRPQSKMLHWRARTAKEQARKVFATSYRPRSVFHGPRGKPLPPLRTILSMSPVQPAENPRYVRIELEVFDDLELSTVWVRHRDEWISVGTVSAATGSSAPRGRAVHHVDLDLAELAGQLQQQSQQLIDNIPDDDEEDEHSFGRFHFYVQAASAERKPPPSGGYVEAAENGYTFCYPLGRARWTSLPEFSPVNTSAGRMTPYINWAGIFSVAINDAPGPNARVHNDGLTVTDGRLRIHGRVTTRHTPMTAAHLSIVGRANGYVASTEAKLTLQLPETTKSYGLRQYRFAAEYDLAADLNEITDDIADLYLDLETPDAEQPVHRRIGRSRYPVRLRTRGGTVKNADSVLSIVPYYTYQAKNPALKFEVFSPNSHRTLTSSLRKPRLLRRQNSRPVWVIGEMPYKAQDNGMHFFRFMREQHPEIDAYYIIDPASPEVVNLEGYDNVIAHRSAQHIDTILRADKIIGTHQPLQVYPTRSKAFSRRLRATHVFLQHGVVAAKWIAPVFARTASDFHTDLVLVSSEREKEFFVYDCGYRTDDVAVTGLARFDALLAGDTSTNPRQLFVMPTWRPWLQDPETFEDSDYFQRWMELLTSEDFRNLVVTHGLEPVFFLHPNMRQYSHLFEGHSARVVVQGEVDVQHLLKESAVMLTDYSSAALDFTFLHKPVVYYQFDAHRFTRPHADPLTELPGPILSTAEGAVQHLESAFANDGHMTSEYLSRTHRFLEHRDRDNCRRIFELISDYRPRRRVWEKSFNSEFGQVLLRYLRKHKFYMPTMKFVYTLLRALPLDPDTVVFESNLARQFTGNPRAVYNELVERDDARKKVIITNQRIRNRDPNTTVVKRNSPGFFWNLARAKYWVNNQNFPHYIRRRRNGVYVQTWHGTALKRMFHDQAAIVGRDAGYMARVQKSVAQWSDLVSPNRFTTDALRSSYGYTGPVHELGYPRNDILNSPRREQVAEGVRQRLGLGPDKVVVLYAPTFRDDKPTARGRFAFEWPFAPEEFHNALGNDVVLLVRTHSLVNTKPRVPRGLRENIIDVSGYPDIQELFLVSDILVTDYSSVFFDYAPLQRPMIFYAYDLENYRDNIRGFYLDYTTDLPGPIVTESTELFETIEKYIKEPPDFAVANESFLARFTPYDDGSAAGRVADLLS